MTTLTSTITPTVQDVINHYNAHFKLELSKQEINDVTEYLKSL